MESESAACETSAATGSCPDFLTPNIGNGERLLSVVAGVGLIGQGLRHLSCGGLLATLAGGGLIYRGLTGHCSAYQALGVNRAGFGNPAVGVRARRGVRIEHTLDIARPAQELYHVWRNLENLPHIFRRIVAVRPESNDRALWIVRGPFQIVKEVQAEIINDRKGELIAWRSLPGSSIDTAGSVHFTPIHGDQGTLLRVSLKFDPPGGKLAARVSRWLGVGLDNQIRDDLFRFKRMMERGGNFSVRHTQPPPAPETASPDARPVCRRECSTAEDLTHYAAFVDSLRAPAFVIFDPYRIVNE